MVKGSTCAYKTRVTITMSHLTLGLYQTLWVQQLEPNKQHLCHDQNCSTTPNLTATSSWNILSKKAAREGVSFCPPTIQTTVVTEGEGGQQRHNQQKACCDMMPPSTSRKSTQPATGTLLFTGCCHNASTHCQMSGRASATGTSIDTQLVRHIIAPPLQTKLQLKHN